MKNIILLIGLSLTISACGVKQSSHSQGVNIATPFQPYVNRFLSYSQTYGGPSGLSDLNVSFDNTGITGRSGNVIVLAVCRSGGNSTPQVLINESWWTGAANSAREQLMFHELGHCVLGRGHTTDGIVTVDSNGTLPSSIMNPYHLQAWIYQLNYNYYMAELFGANPVKALYLSGNNQYADAPYYPALPVASTTSVAKISIDELVTNENGEYVLDGMGCGDE